MDKKIISMSAPRSGSTFINQILRMIFNEVYTDHNFSVDANVVIFRNFLDSGISYYRVIHDKPPKFIIKEKKEIEWIIKNYNPYIENIFKFLKNKNNILFFVYDFDIKLDGEENNYKLIFNKIENFFGITIPTTKKEEIIKNTNFKINKKRSSMFKNFSSWDKNNFIHGNHINNGGINIWKSHISENLHQFYEESLFGNKFKNIIKELGYINH